MSIAVSFKSYEEAIQAKIDRNMRAGFKDAAVELSIGYQRGLQASIAPPHSEPGEIPHAYWGHIQGGYGPLKGIRPNEVQNTPQYGFAQNQAGFLSSYIEGGVSGSGLTLQGEVGFEPSHVASREKNYLIQWDQGKVPGSDDRRPWVIPLFQQAKAAMISAFRDAVRKMIR